MWISTSRIDAIVQALRATRDSSPSNTDAAYTRLATEIVKTLAPISFGSGPPSEPIIPVSQVGDLYCDQNGGQFYEYAGFLTGWVSLGMGSPAPPPPAFSPYFPLVIDGSGLSFYGYKETGVETFGATETWYTDATKTTKVLEKMYVLDGNQNPTTITWRFYNAGTLLRTITDTVIYSGVQELSRTRVVT